ncbi:hypothetical protein ACIOHS_12075 [Streptomyces sp. NPDC088253]|uniref:hypothetical protein n=1 Tax=Streptomyces sp. NPDC088253 TaxID=3365846 RepID=UPI003800533E
MRSFRVAEIVILPFSVAGQARWRVGAWDQCRAAGHATRASSAVSVSSAAAAPSRARCDVIDTRWVTGRVIDATGGSGL